MTPKHPFSFYFDLIHKKHLSTIKQDFYNSAVDNGIQEPFNKDEEWINDCFEEGVNVMFIRIYFNEYLERFLDEQRSNAIEQMEFLLLDEPDFERTQIKLGSYLSSLEALMAQAQEDMAISNYPVIIKNFQRLHDYLMLKGQSYGIIVANRTKNPTKKYIGNKLQWTDTAQALATLFYKLCYEHRNNGNPLINFKNKSDIVSLIVDNFIASDGLPFEESTISDSMKANKVEKRPVKTVDLEGLLTDTPLQPKKGTR
jgi:hypothetical protein